MSVTSQVGALGVALQTAKGAPVTAATATAALGAAGGFTFIPSMTIPHFPQRLTESLPNEISGTRGNDGSYVRGTLVAGEFAGEKVLVIAKEQRPFAETVEQPFEHGRRGFCHHGRGGGEARPATG